MIDKTSVGKLCLAQIDSMEVPGMTLFNSGRRYLQSLRKNIATAFRSAVFVQGKLQEAVSVW